MITTTEATARKMLSELNSKNTQKKKDNLPEFVGFRLSVSAGKCSGLSYNFYPVYFVDPKFDVLFESNGVKIYVDKKSLKFVDGTEIDCEADNLLASYRFNNPNAKSSCGCGTSFELK